MTICSYNFSCCGVYFFYLVCTLYDYMLIQFLLLRGVFLIFSFVPFMTMLIQFLLLRGVFLIFSFVPFYWSLSLSIYFIGAKEQVHIPKV